MKYRSEIDGLRAVAVVPVILFHAGFAMFEGGFVGVDVFFVISGYLITSILIEEVEGDGISLLRFYERRARRILPALSVVVLACVPFAWAWMTPVQLKDFGQSVAAVALFASNILFWLEADYFGADAELKPLLHTWSLAVEEQYYLFFPLLLIWLGRGSSRSLFWILAAIAAVSLVVSEWAWRIAPEANFYLAPGRVWELFAGSLCALWMHRNPPSGNNALAALGLVLIAISVSTFDASVPFPSLFALLPVVGCCLIILFAQAGTLTARALSLRWVVGIGLISYSAYLWHQPLFAFARIRSLAEPGPILMLSLAALSLALAWVSYRFVEAPFRRRERRALNSRPSLFGASAAALMAFLAIGMALHAIDGAPWRTAPLGETYASMNFAEQLDGNRGLDDRCNGLVQDDACRTGPSEQVVLWGDSYAMHLALALQSSPTVTPFRQSTLQSCAPLTGIALKTPKLSHADVAECITFNDQVFASIISNPEVSVVIASSIFSILWHPLYGPDGPLAEQGEQANFIAEQYVDLADRLAEHGKTLVMISPPPRNGHDIGACLVRASILGEDMSRCSFTRADFSAEMQTVEAFLKSVEEHIPVIWLSDQLCASGTCMVAMPDGVFVYRDGGHLTKEASRRLGASSDLMRRALDLATTARATP